MPVTLDDLIQATRRLADSNFATAAALNKMLPAWEQLRRDVHDSLTHRELDQAQLNLALNNFNKDLALLLDNVKRAQTDVRELQRDVTGAHNQVNPRDERSPAEKIIDRFERARTSTKLWVFAFVLVVGLAFGAHLILAAFGIGG